MKLPKWWVISYHLCDHVVTTVSSEKLPRDDDVVTKVLTQ
jgi:hypothetical protein